MKRRTKARTSRQRIIMRLIIAFLIIFVVAGGVVLYKVYNDAQQAANMTYKSVKHNSQRNANKAIKDGKSFSILILGTDTGEFGRTYKGRSDTIMVAVVNPSKKRLTLTSIPRDTKVAIVGHGFNNKMNAAYAYDGVSGAMNTVQSYLNVPIDHYIEMNMKGLVKLSAALGSVKVSNDLDFTNSGYHFTKGKVVINQKNILAFTRERHQDPRGDYGRQLRQRRVVAALLKKAKSFEGVSNYKKILNALSDNMKTDISFNQMKTIATKYNDIDKINQIQLQGEGKMINGVSYEVVPDSTVNKVSAKLRTEMNLSNKNQ